MLAVSGAAWFIEPSLLSGLPPVRVTAVSIVSPVDGGPSSRPTAGVIAQVSDPLTAQVMYDLVRVWPLLPKPAPSCPASPSVSYSLTFLQAGGTIPGAQLIPGAWRMVRVRGGKVLWASNMVGDVLISMIATALHTTPSQIDRGS